MNPEQVEIVKQGKEAIDEWRQDHPGERLDLYGADLSEANLFGTALYYIDLSRADLCRTDLSRADLVSANLSYANLLSANLSGANLSGANLSGARLLNASLPGADLMGANLVRANLTRAELTGARMYGTARDDWNIEGIKCRYVFWDQGRASERSPKDRDLEPGEFERLYAQLPTIEYIFEQGMTPLDPLVMDRIVQAINDRTPEFYLQIDSINARGLQPAIKFTVRHEVHKAPALEAVVQGYEAKLLELEGERNVLYKLISDKLDNPQNIYLTNAQPGSLVAVDGSSINIQEYIHHLEEIERAIEEAPPETLTDAAKREALEALNGTIRDAANGMAKEVAAAVIQLGIRSIPSIINTPAYQFLTNPPQ